jgi:hypothetical protein
MWTNSGDAPDETQDERATEILCRVFVWMADAPTMLDRGLRATIALNCLRPDLLGGPTFRVIGVEAARTDQYVHQLADDFRTLIAAH